MMLAKTQLFYRTIFVPADRQSALVDYVESGLRGTVMDLQAPRDGKQWRLIQLPVEITEEEGRDEKDWIFEQNRDSLIFSRARDNLRKYA